MTTETTQARVTDTVEPVVGNRVMSEQSKSVEDTVEPLVRLVALVREVMFWHRDKESVDYNECETLPCRWCEEAQKAIDALPNIPAETRPASGRSLQPIVGGKVGA